MTGCVDVCAIVEHSEANVVSGYAEAHSSHGVRDSGIVSKMVFKVD